MKSIIASLSFLIIFGFTNSDSKKTYDQKIIDKAIQIHTKWKSSKNTVIIVDFSKPMEENRLFVVDVIKKQILIQTKTCHGVGSGKTSKPTKFSNVEGSLASSLGVMKTGNTYYGSYGYSMLIDGLESTNSNARSRKIIFHSSKKQETPWSWGCFSMPEKDYKKVIDLTKGGSLIYASDGKDI
jgi:hypothetical protein